MWMNHKVEKSIAYMIDQWGRSGLTCRYLIVDEF